MQNIGRKVSRSRAAKVAINGEAQSLAQFIRAREFKGNVRLTVDDHVVLLTHLEKEYWPDDHFTKGDLLRYYAQMADTILPYLADRPLILKRYPNGVNQPFFYQHDVNETPEYVETIPLEAEGGRVIDYVVCNNTAALLYLVNLATIAQNPWHSRIDSLENPDWIVFDLDPQHGTKYRSVCEVAVAIQELLTRINLKSYPKTSGSRGMHLYVPIKPDYTYDQIAQFARQLAVVVTAELPQIATVERSISRRKEGMVYVDHLQNARGKTVVSPYSVRGRHGATVSMPLLWSDVKGLNVHPDDYTMESVPKLIKRLDDHFAGVLMKPQSLATAMSEVNELYQGVRSRRGRVPTLASPT